MRTSVSTMADPCSASPRTAPCRVRHSGAPSAKVNDASASGVALGRAAGDHGEGGVVPALRVVHCHHRDNKEVCRRNNPACIQGTVS